MQEQGRSLRKHNFHLGYDNPTKEQALTAEQHQRAKSIGPIKLTTTNAGEIKRSHFSIGNKAGNDYSTISKMA
jgi:hypothetical protein